MDPSKIHTLSSLIRQQGDKLLTSEFKLSLTGDLLRALNDSFSLIIDDTIDLTFQVTKPNNSKTNVFRELMFIYDFIQKTQVLKLTKHLDDDNNSLMIDISKFRNLTTLEIQRIPINRIIGLQQLRQQLQELNVEKCLTDIKDIIMHCAGDKCSGFIWNSLKRIDFSYNNLERVDNSFEFTPYLQFLNLSHNKIIQISALVYLPNLKILNLSFNQLTNIPKLNIESYRRLQVLIINDNFIEDVSGLARLDALLELDISGNCLLDHSLLLPLCTLNALRYLNLSGNPLACHPRHRDATCRYLSRNAATVHFQLDVDLLSKHEKSLTGSYENYYPIYGHRIRTTSNTQTSTTKSISNTPDDISLSSNNSLNSPLNVSTAMMSSQKKVKPRSISDIEESGKETQVRSPVFSKLLREGSKDHLTTKREIEQLREQYGNEWLFNQDLYENGESAGNRRFESGHLLSKSPILLRMDESFERNEPLDRSTPEDDKVTSTTGETVYESVIDTSTDYQTPYDSTFTESEEPKVLSDAEDGEAVYVVVDETSRQYLAMVICEKIIKERDAMTGKTITRWGMSTLQSVERVRPDVVHLTFDTIRKDKKERFYELEECEEVVKLLRDYLSARPLSEMNQTVYKCSKCNSQFCRENDERKKSRQNDIKCPSCGSIYIIELPKTNKNPSPKSSFVPETVLAAFNRLQRPASVINIDKRNEESSAVVVPRTSHSFSSIESAFDSNRSVAGSSVEVLSESSSHKSQTSQSSIEVLDQHGSRKQSEERKISAVPYLDTIRDDSDRILEDALVAGLRERITAERKAALSIGNVNLTESSSSGSVCESVCTAYEQNGKKKTVVEEPKNPLEGIFKTSAMLLAKAATKMEPEAEKMNNQILKPIQYNFDDLQVVDHRLKLHLFQHVLEDNDEKFMWLIKCEVIEDDTSSTFVPVLALIAMSTKKIYLLKIVGAETENIDSWLRKSMTYSIDHIVMIRSIIFDTGLSFLMKTNFNFHILLRDSKLSGILQQHITTSNQKLEINTTELSPYVSKKLLDFTDQFEPKYLIYYKSCTMTFGSKSHADDGSVIEIGPRKEVKLSGVVIVTTEGLHLTTDFRWLCESISSKANDCHTFESQPMTNLVDVEDLAKESFTLVFVDDIKDVAVRWMLKVDSFRRTSKFLEETNKIWRKIFSVSLVTRSQILSSS